MKRLVLFSALMLSTCRPWEHAFENAIDGGLIITTDAGPDQFDAGFDAGLDAGPLEIDAGSDAGVDAGLADAGRCPGGGWCLSTRDAGLAIFGAGGGVWASSPTDAYVTLVSARVLHWNGVRWNLEVLNNRFAYVNTVWGTTRDDVYLGLRGEPTLHGPPFDAAIDGGPYDLRMIRGTADGSAIYGVGDDWAVYRLDGTPLWQRVELGIAPPTSSSEMRALEVVSANELWLISKDNALLHSINGTDWSTVATMPWTVNRAFATSANDVWFAGAGGHVSRWNGSALQTANCADCENIVGVWGRGPNDMWLYSQNATLVHWDGTAYTVQDAIAPNDNTFAGTLGLWGVGDFDLFFTSFDTDNDVLAYHLIR